MSRAMTNTSAVFSFDIVKAVCKNYIRHEQARLNKFAVFTINYVDIWKDVSRNL